MKNLRFLVLDEADRMIETGHFAELDNILRLTQRQFRYVSCLRLAVRHRADPSDLKAKP
jgi:superfamily II DNA/RNA helicase